MTTTLSVLFLEQNVVVIHEGLCTKESGTAFFGKTNWRRRWFKLIQKKNDVLLQYYK